jgi:NADH dehydrogenase [ubiquinone] 1 alpha subcomplex assembly factor 5
MPAELFDMKLRALRRDLAFRHGPELFLFERAFADTLERLDLVNRRFRSALLLGCPDPAWPSRLEGYAMTVAAADPGRLFASAAGGEQVIEDDWTPSGKFDLCVAIGTLDSVNDLPRALATMRGSLQPDALLIGAISGGDSLPRLRQAMHAADRAMGGSSPHVHPRLDGPTLAALLSASGFVMPVVDVDRVQVTYAALDRLVGDLRRMGATNILHGRARRPLSHAAVAAAAAAFASAGDGSRTKELFEILHFAAWTPASARGGHQR